MIQRFLNYINQNNLFNSSERVLLAISGGLDSVVMCHLFYTAKIPFAIAHCNFQLRGNDSNEDESFVQQLGDNYNTTVHSIRFDTEKYVVANGVSIQMAARDLRYEWFRTLIQANHYQSIATAHHANDQVETILLNLTSGTGLRGLRGIKPQSHELVRPLLFATRKDLEKYATIHHLQWREDSSNASLKYKRNAIRHLVVPQLETLNPNFIASIIPFTHKMRLMEQLLDNQVDFWRNKVLTKIDEVTYIALQPFDGVSYKALLLYEILKEFDFETVDDILNCVDSIAGKAFHSVSHSLVIDRQQLVITPKSKVPCQQFEIAAETTHLIVGKSHFEIELIDQFSMNAMDKSKNLAYLDYSSLAFPLLLRKWAIGDTFKPLGMRGRSKKISDLLIDAKVPNNLKSHVWLLESNAEIIWVVGYQISETVKINAKTNKVLKITHLKNQ
jgi:tRNA(Ile)-lysidine synthase